MNVEKTVIPTEVIVSDEMEKAFKKDLELRAVFKTDKNEINKLIEWTQRTSYINND